MQYSLTSSTLLAIFGVASFASAAPAPAPAPGYSRVPTVEQYPCTPFGPYKPFGVGHTAEAICDLRTLKLCNTQYINYCTSTMVTGDCFRQDVKIDYSCTLLEEKFQKKIMSIDIPKGTACAMHEDKECKDINTSPNGGASLSYPGSNDLSKFGPGWAGRVSAISCWKWQGAENSK